MNSAAVFGASLRSGYALPACRPENGTVRNQPAEDPLIQRRVLSRRSRPPLYADDLKIVRRTAFCREYRPAERRFFAVDDPDYEHEE